MSGITATQNLSYPTGTDLVKDHSSWVETLARQVDARLTSHDLDAARYGDSRPLCRLKTSGTQVVTPGSANRLDQIIKFDVVDVDTDGMANLDALNWGVIVNTAGYYRYGFYVSINSTGCVLGTGYAQFAINNSLPSSIPAPQPSFIGGGRVTTAPDNQTGYSCNACSSGVARVDNPPALIGGVSASIYAGTTCFTTLTVLTARMWVYKIRDYP